MQVTGLRTERVEVPFATPVRTAIHHIESVSCVLLRLDTDEGHEGQCYMFAFGQRRAKVLEAMAHALAGHVVGRDPDHVQAIWQDMWRDNNFLGHRGVPVFALAAIDAALWDLRGKAAGRAVWRLLGGMRDRVPAYASGGLWVSLTVDELQAEARRFVADGFRAVKMRFGKASVAEDAERCAAVREAIGPDVRLMADANQGFTVNHAIRLGRAIERHDLTWFEEPVQAYDLKGSARVAAELDTPIASGETEYGRYGFRDMLERKSADVLMPDLERVGGITEWVRVAHMAAAHDVPVSPHLFTEHCLQLCGALSNVSYAEHMPWFAPIFQEPVEMVDGALLIPDRPGLGFRFDPDAVGRYAVD